jgi:segregation and condensation protein A
MMEEDFVLKDSANMSEKLGRVESGEKIGQEQIHGLLFGEQLSWQSIIYDLINTEQLDPWNIDLTILSNKYLEKVREMEEANFFVSSKVLFAASLLLRIKSEILLNHYLPSLDDILFGREDKKRYSQERLELDEDVPELIQKTPMPRFRKVTLEELMGALGKAIKTENRRIQKVVMGKQQERETAIALPRRTINIQDKIKEIYGKVKGIFKTRDKSISFSEFSEMHNGGDRVGTFVPLLHLDNQHKVLLEQEKHLAEIHVWLKELHDNKNKGELEKMRKEADLAAIEERLEDPENRKFSGPTTFKNRKKVEGETEESEKSEAENLK